MLENKAVEESIQYILKTCNNSFKYQLLDRMRSDCLYYLGNGGRKKKHLWGLSESDHIECMKLLWNSFNENEKPEWLTWEDLIDFENQMM